MRRVVITGAGIVSCLGNNLKEVLSALQAQRSGIQFIPDYQEIGMKSHVAGRVNIELDELINRKLKRFMGDAAAYAYLAMQEAITQAGLNAEHISHTKTGLVVGSGGSSFSDLVESVDIARERGVKRVGPYRVTRAMNSTVSANLATAYAIKGVNYSISSACATSGHCIGHAMQLIQTGQQDIVFAGGGEEEHWSMSMQFDAMGALSSSRNDTPEQASRPYCKHRDGFVIAGGGGILVLEEYEHAKQRGANILAELIGYGATSDGADMVAPSGEGAVRCMRQALANFTGTVDYINTHGTSTPAGDITELNAIAEVFGANTPAISSTKSLTGHSLGATSVQEAIYCLLMMEHGFISGNAHIEELDEDAQDFDIVQENRPASLQTVLSNSFGFGGTNACLLLQKLA